MMISNYLGKSLEPLSQGTFQSEVDLIKCLDLFSLVLLKSLHYSGTQ